MSAETNILSFAGELTIVAAAGLREEFAVRLTREHTVVLDLSGVECCDAAGLQLLWSLRKSADERNAAVRLSAVSPAVQATAAGIGLSLKELSREGSGASSEL